MDSFQRLSHSIQQVITLVTTLRREKDDLRFQLQEYSGRPAADQAEWNAKIETIAAEWRVRLVEAESHVQQYQQDMEQTRIQAAEDRERWKHHMDSLQAQLEDASLRLRHQGPDPELEKRNVELAAEAERLRQELLDVQLKLEASQAAQESSQAGQALRDSMAESNRLRQELAQAAAGPGQDSGIMEKCRILEMKLEESRLEQGETDARALQLQAQILQLQQDIEEARTQAEEQELALKAQVEKLRVELEAAPRFPAPAGPDPALLADLEKLRGESEGIKSKNAMLEARVRDLEAQAEKYRQWETDKQEFKKEQKRATAALRERAMVARRLEEILNQLENVRLA